MEKNQKLDFKFLLIMAGSVALAEVILGFVGVVLIIIFWFVIYLQSKKTRSFTEEEQYMIAGKIVNEYLVEKEKKKKFVDQIQPGYKKELIRLFNEKKDMFGKEDVSSEHQDEFIDFVISLYKSKNA